MKRLLQLLLAVSIFVASAVTAQQITPVITVDNPPNTLAQQAKHYVILVSLDGFRYDYPAKYGAPHLLAMAKDGASAPDGMLPSYPSLTFPNHLSIATGLYPEHHGIVANSFFDPSRTPEQGQTYVYTQSKTNGDGSWYGGTPLWVLAEQQGMRSACFFWPGSEAEIQGKRPSYYLKFDNKLDDAKRVDQVIAWLGLPPEQRPHFITLYYSNVDHAGHEYGPDSDEVRAAVHHVDDMIGDLQTKLAALKLPVDLIVLADHGMVTLKGDPIDLSTFADLSGVHTEGSLIYAKDDAEAERIYQQFKAHPDPRFSVYRRADVPEHLHFNSNPREGDPVVVPNGPYTLRTKPLPAGASMSGTLHGGHGFDPSTMPEMKAIFFANGPDIKHGVKLPPFENVNIYPFIAELLNLRAPIGDGNAKVLSKARAGSDPHFIQQMDLEKAPDKALKPEPVSDETAFKIGPGITPPRQVRLVYAKHTDQARMARTQGTVKLRIRIEKDGRVSQIAITKGLERSLDISAVRAWSQCTFTPGLKDGKPVVVEADVESSFSMP
jgi:alkaline phosphatase D